MQNIPNAISLIRILLSVLLLCCKPFSPLFWIVYATCGFSDIIDGYIARKTNSTSSLGAMLDSIADLAFIGAAMIVLLPAIAIPVELLIWIALIALVRVFSLMVGYHKYHTLAALHTYTNKATGLLLFIFPFLYKPVGVYILGYVICTMASISATEELILQIKSKRLFRDIVKYPKNTDKYN